MCERLSGVVEVSRSVTTIGNAAFYRCLKITEFSLGENINSIGDEAFSSCRSLVKLRIATKTPPEVYSRTFNDIFIEKFKVDVPADAVSDYQSADYLKYYIFISENQNTGILKNNYETETAVYPNPTQGRLFINGMD